MLDSCPICENPLLVLSIAHEYQYLADIKAGTNKSRNKTFYMVELVEGKSAGTYSKFPDDNIYCGTCDRRFTPKEVLELHA
tara:strand:+ start:210 stop:452 length:243 start_codon:yes stop_codon:yes gene_type:complete